MIRGKLRQDLEGLGRGAAVSAMGREVTDRRGWLSSPSAPSWGCGCARPWPFETGLVRLSSLGWGPRRETGQSLGRAGGWEEPGSVESATGRVQRPRLGRTPCSAGPGAAAASRHQGGRVSPSSVTEKDFADTKTKMQKETVLM